ncbi:MAG: Rab family GTPase [Candidatus Heimdallarchaeota archaeon]
MNDQKKLTFKIIIIGEPAVGKTSLVKRFVSGKFSRDYLSSIGTNIYTKKLELDNETRINLQLWDIAGQERWINMRRSYYSGAKGVIIVGDLTRENTFVQIEKFWALDIGQFCSDAPILLLANKIDLPNTFKHQKISSLGERIKAIDIIMTSAKTGENVEQAFKMISKEVIKKNN